MSHEEEIAKREGFNVIRLQRLNLNLGTCNRCGLPWNECSSKTIIYEQGRGIFAMCTFCWDQSDLEERLHHYKTLWYSHRNMWNDNYDWLIVEANIRKESELK